MLSCNAVTGVLVNLEGEKKRRKKEKKKGTWTYTVSILGENHTIFETGAYVEGRFDRRRGIEGVTNDKKRLSSLDAAKATLISLFRLDVPLSTRGSKKRGEIPEHLALVPLLVKLWQEVVQVVPAEILVATVNSERGISCHAPLVSLAPVRQDRGRVRVEIHIIS